MARNRFKHGSGCYTCSNCKRQTRDTGQGEGDNGYCAHCWEMFGWENTVTDNGEDSEEGKIALREIERLKAEIVARGGNLE